MPIAGKPLIWHIVHRLKKARLIDQIMLATTVNLSDDLLCDWADHNGVAYVRGSEDDVLSRFELAANMCRADIILRVNADAPLIDAAFIDHMLETMIADGADFVTLPAGLSVAHDGVDPMSRRALDLMLDVARDDPVAREHVTGWLKQNSHLIKVATLSPDPAYRFSGARLSVDTPADVNFIEAVYDRLHAQAGEASLTDLIGLLRRDPDLLAINGHVRQKSVDARRGIVILRCDGGEALGLGHVKRCLALAHALRDGEGFGVVFAMIGDDRAASLALDAGFAVDRRPESESEAKWLERLARQLDARGLVLDIRTDLNEADIRRLRSSCSLIVALDDASDRRLAAHLAVYPPVPQTRALSINAGDAELRIGWEWTLMGSSLWRQPRQLDSRRATLRVLVAMGGSDPHGLTLRTVKAVAAAGRRVTPVVVVGPAVRFPECVADACRAAAPDAEIILAPASVTPVAACCDLAVISFGVTALECAHVGTPAIYLGLNADHAMSAQGFQDAGFGISMGIADCMKDQALTDVILALSSDPERRLAMAATGRLAIDGRGAERLAAEISRRVSGSQAVIQVRAG
jgi:spore coat polysaccharide biosynthesis protein SpsF